MPAIRTSSLDDISIQNSWLTIGIYDGVHRGHQELLRGLVDNAHSVGVPAVVLTFEPHPAIVLGGRTDFRNLSTSDERFALLESCGVDVVITERFTRDFANQTAEEYMQRVMRSLQLRCLFVGYDTALGRGREGNAIRLAEIGKKMGFVVQQVPPLTDDRGVISSSRIRSAIASGNVSIAARDLGRFYEISGPVIHGDGRGHRIDIPTANILPPPGKIIPANGIYACFAWLENTNQANSGNPSKPEKFLAATNIGVRPTFTPDLQEPAIEAHLLDFNRNIYDQQVRLEFVEYLRPEEKFATIEALVSQIQEDIRLTREILTKCDC